MKNLLICLVISSFLTGCQSAGYKEYYELRTRQDNLEKTFSQSTQQIVSAVNAHGQAIEELKPKVEPKEESAKPVEKK